MIGSVAGAPDFRLPGIAQARSGTEATPALDVEMPMLFEAWPVERILTRPVDFIDELLDLIVLQGEDRAQHYVELLENFSEKYSSLPDKNLVLENRKRLQEGYERLSPRILALRQSLQGFNPTDLHQNDYFVPAHLWRPFETLRAAITQPNSTLEMSAVPADSRNLQMLVSWMTPWFESNSPEQESAAYTERAREVSNYEETRLGLLQLWEEESRSSDSESRRIFTPENQGRFFYVLDVINAYYPRLFAGTETLTWLQNEQQAARGRAYHSYSDNLGALSRYFFDHATGASSRDMQETIHELFHPYDFHKDWEEEFWHWIPPEELLAYFEGYAAFLDRFKTFLEGDVSTGTPALSGVDAQLFFFEPWWMRRAEAHGISFGVDQLTSLDDFMYFQHEMLQIQEGIASLTRSPEGQRILQQTGFLELFTTSEEPLLFWKLRGKKVETNSPLYSSHAMPSINDWIRNPEKVEEEVKVQLPRITDFSALNEQSINEVIELSRTLVALPAEKRGDFRLYDLGQLCLEFKSLCYFALFSVRHQVLTQDLVNDENTLAVLTSFEMKQLMSEVPKQFFHMFTGPFGVYTPLAGVYNDLEHPDSTFRYAQQSALSQRGQQAGYLDSHEQKADTSGRERIAEFAEFTHTRILEVGKLREKMLGSKEENKFPAVLQLALRYLEDNGVG